MFFPEEVNIRLMALEPYRSHAIHRTTQEEDDIFGGQDGQASIAKLEPLSGTDFASGSRATLIAAVDPTATPAPAGRC